MKVEQRVVGPIETNCYIVVCEKTPEAIIIELATTQAATPSSKKPQTPKS